LIFSLIYSIVSRENRPRGFARGFCNYTRDFVNVVLLMKNKGTVIFY